MKLDYEIYAVDERLTNVKNYLVNVVLCRDVKDCITAMNEYADRERSISLFPENVKVNKTKRIVAIGGISVTKFISNQSYLDGLHVREIEVSRQLAKYGDLDKLSLMLKSARAGMLITDSI